MLPRSVILLGLSAAVLLSAWLHRSIFPLELQGIHNWRQSQTMWNVYNFVHQDNNILNPRVSHLNGSNDNLLRYEFPVMQWAIAQVVRLFGHEVATARVCVFLITVLGALGFYRLLRVMAFGRGVAVSGTILLLFSPVLYFYSVNVLPDLLALAAAIWYLSFVFSYIRTRRAVHLWAAAAFLCLATLAKLPFALFGIVSVVHFFRLLFSRVGGWRSALAVAGAHLLLITPAVAWYAWVMPGWTDNPVLYGIFASTNSRGENLRILHHYADQYIPYDLLSPAVWLPMLIGVVWPWRPAAGIPRFRSYLWALALMTLLYVGLQWNTINTVHDYYLLPLLPWMYVVATAGLARLYELVCRFGVPRVGVALLIVLVCAAPVYAYRLRQPAYAVDRSYHYEELQDVLANAKDLQAAAPDEATVIVLNDNALHIFTWLIRKRGYVFWDDSVRPLWIKDMIDNYGATYLYSTSRRVDDDPGAAPYLDRLIMERGNVRVYRLAPPEG